MNFEEHAAKSLVLAPAGIPMPRGILCVERARKPPGGRARSAPAWSRRRCRPANAARPAASSWPTRRRKPSRWPRQILGMTHRRLHGRAPADRGAGQDRARVLCRRAARRRRAQAADPVLDRRRHGHRGGGGREARGDPPPAGRHRRRAARRPTSPACSPASISARRRHRSRRSSRSSTPPIARATPSCLEINPLALLADGRVVALDCKFVLDDAALYRQSEIAKGGAAAAMTALEAARRRCRPQADPARRQCRRAGQRRRSDHDHHGRDPPLRRQAGEFPRDRRRGLYQVRDRARSGAVQSGREKPGDQFLRRLRAHRRDGRRRGARPGTS